VTTEFVISPEDDCGAVTLNRIMGQLEISQDNGRAFPPTIYLTNAQAEQLRDYLNDLFDVEK